MENSSNVSPNNGDGTDVSDVFLILWEVRKFVFWALILTFLVSVSFLIFARISVPSVQTYQTNIRFLFDGAKQGLYPNESPFAPSDMLSANVLKKVYQQNNLIKFGIKEDQFFSAVSVKPYSPTIDSVIEGYNQQLKNKKLSFTERKKIEAEMQKDLDQLGKSAILLRLTFLQRFPIPKIMAEKILSDIPAIWAKTSIEELGVVELKPVMGNHDFVDLKELNNYEPLIRMEFLDDAIDTLREKLSRFKRYAGMETIFDQGTGFNIFELERKINFLKDYELSRLKIKIIKNSGIANTLETKEFLQLHLKSFALKKENFEKKSEKIKQSLFFYDRSKQPLAETTVTQGGKADILQGKSAPQVSEGFINKVIELTQQKRDTDFRQKLVKKYTHLYNQSLFFAAQEKSTSDLIDSIDSIKKNGEEAGKNFSSNIGQIVKKLNGLNKILFNLRLTLSKNQFPEEKRLYQQQLLPSDLSFQSYHPIMNKFNFMIVFLAMIGVAIITLLISLISRILKQGSVHK